MVVPQSLAYAANIADLPARYGLYSSYIGVIVYGLLGTSKDITLGPTAIMSKVVEESSGSSMADCDLYGGRRHHFDHRFLVGARAFHPLNHPNTAPFAVRHSVATLYFAA